ncbi:flagellar hook-length control protein FliK [Litchfieldia alkalitelluris]|uniref:flagellar hook-length control protein FliK n=1 Tax=Litchfieldia alkalitelluris TaxID=304268 RepID=UPI00099646D2|nr:flagellar hook-length control protein FliK [Litchfieldia alkalitelluris]
MNSGLESMLNIKTKTDIGKLLNKKTEMGTHSFSQYLVETQISGKPVTDVNKTTHQEDYLFVTEDLLSFVKTGDSYLFVNDEALENDIDVHSILNLLPESSANEIRGLLTNNNSIDLSLSDGLEAEKVVTLLMILSQQEKSGKEIQLPARTIEGIKQLFSKNYKVTVSPINNSLSTLLVDFNIQLALNNPKKDLSSLSDVFIQVVDENVAFVQDTSGPNTPVSDAMVVLMDNIVETSSLIHHSADTNVENRPASIIFSSTHPRGDRNEGTKREVEDNRPALITFSSTHPRGVRNEGAKREVEDNEGTIDRKNPVFTIHEHSLETLTSIILNLSHYLVGEKTGINDDTEVKQTIGTFNISSENQLRQQQQQRVNSSIEQTLAMTLNELQIPEKSELVSLITATIDLSDSLGLEESTSSVREEIRNLIQINFSENEVVDLEIKLKQFISENTNMTAPKNIFIQDFSKAEVELSDESNDDQKQLGLSKHGFNLVVAQEPVFQIPQGENQIEVLTSSSKQMGEINIETRNGLTGLESAHSSLLDIELSELLINIEIQKSFSDNQKSLLMEVMKLFLQKTNSPDNQELNLKSLVQGIISDVEQQSMVVFTDKQVEFLKLKLGEFIKEIRSLEPASPQENSRIVDDKTLGLNNNSLIEKTNTQQQIPSVDGFRRNNLQSPLHRQINEHIQVSSFDRNIRLNNQVNEQNSLLHSERTNQPKNNQTQDGYVAKPLLQPNSKLFLKPNINQLTVPREYNSQKDLLGLGDQKVPAKTVVQNVNQVINQLLEYNQIELEVLSMIDSVGEYSEEQKLSLLNLVNNMILEESTLKESKNLIKQNIVEIFKEFNHTEIEQEVDVLVERIGDLLNRKNLFFENTPVKQTLMQDSLVSESESTTEQMVQNKIFTNEKQLLKPFEEIKSNSLGNTVQAPVLNSEKVTSNNSGRFFETLNQQLGDTFKGQLKTNKQQNGFDFGIGNTVKVSSLVEESSLQIQDSSVQEPIKSSPRESVANSLFNIDVTDQVKPFSLENPTVTRLQQYVIHIGQPTGGSQTKNEFISQFYEVLSNSKFKTIANGHSQMVIKFKPEHLGSLIVKLTQVDGEFSVKIITASNGAKELVESNIHQLRALFQIQGLTFDKLETYSQQQYSDLLRDPPDSEKENQQQQQRRKNEKDHLTPEESFKDSLQDEILNISV